MIKQSVPYGSLSYGMGGGAIVPKHMNKGDSFVLKAELRHALSRKIPLRLHAKLLRSWRVHLCIPIPVSPNWITFH